jgi:hypothetical protein
VAIYRGHGTSAYSGYLERVDGGPGGNLTAAPEVLDMGSRPVAEYLADPAGAFLTRSRSPQRYSIPLLAKENSAAVAPHWSREIWGRGHPQHKQPHSAAR